MTTRRTTLLNLCAALTIVAIPPGVAQGQDKPPAIDGYDPVAYFTEKKPVPGKPEFSRLFDDKRYLFASAKHRDLFAANPERYEPQFNGLCAGGVSKGSKMKADPTIWRVIDGKLYVYSMQMSSEDKYGSVAAAAQAKWKDMK